MFLQFQHNYTVIFILLNTEEIKDNYKLLNEAGIRYEGFY